MVKGWTLVDIGVVKWVDIPRISGSGLDISGQGCSKMSGYPTDEWFRVRH